MSFVLVSLWITKAFIIEFVFYLQNNARIMNTIQLKKVRILIASIILFLFLVLLIKFCSQRVFDALLQRNARSWENKPPLPSTPEHEPPQSPKENKLLGAWTAKNKNRPGDMGKPVHLTAEEQAKAKELWSLNEFNMVASEKIPLDRTLPDFRHSMCLDMDYNVSSLPVTSIIVIFHNEEFYTVLRTATSCYNRSPPHLLKEIVLVDDFSDREHLKGLTLIALWFHLWPSLIPLMYHYW